MYEFIDVDGVQTKVSLPKEALKLNGTFIENIIDGYRTLHVEGRELLPSFVLGDENSIRDGFSYKGRRYPSRNIKVTFKLTKKDEHEFRKAFNELNKLLKVENSELIFNDELDMYYTGTLTEVGDIEPGSNSVIGSFTFFCPDPFKRSVKEEIHAIDTSKPIEINYTGTYGSYPKLKVIATSDLGYFTLFNAKGGILQVGDPDEVYFDEAQKSKVLLDHNFGKGVSGWGLNVARHCTTSRNSTKEGNVAFSSLDGVYPASFGNAGLKWHGPDITYALSEASKNWSIEWDGRTTYEDINEFGNFEVVVTSSDGMMSIAGVSVTKDATTGYANVELYAFDKLLDKISTDKFFETRDIELHDNWRISKFNSKLDFETPIGRYEFVVPEIEHTPAQKVSFLFNAFSARKAMRMEVYSATFRSHAVNSFEEIPNKFAKGDVIEVDCENGEILLNGLSSPQLGAIGNTWSKMSLESGDNILGFDFSEWSSAPVVEIRFRRLLI